MNVVDVLDRPMQVGDFMLYTVADQGYIEFGLIERIYETPGRYARTVTRIKVSHRNADGTQIYKRTYNSASRQMDETDVESSSTLNYTGSHRFFLTNPI